MGKAEDAVRRSGKLQSGESILGSNSVILTVASNKQKGGFIVQTDKAIYFCVQGGLGLGKVKEVHRLDVDKVMAQRARESALSRGGMDVMFLAPRGDLSIGSPASPEAAQELGDVRMVAAVSGPTRTSLTGAASGV